MKTKIHGNWATLLLPINVDNSIDWSALQVELEILVSANPNGIYSNGTAGEFYAQSDSEFDRIQLMLAETCTSANIPFQIGCSALNPQHTLDRINRIKELKPSAVQVILPDWSSPSSAEVLLYLHKIMEVAEDMDIVLYNPPHAKKVLSPHDYHFLKENGIHLAGCKTGGGDLEWYEVMKELNSELSIFIPGHFLATGIQNGMDGAYSNVCCINPFAAQSWYDSMEEDISGALELEQRIQQFLTLHILPLMKRDNLSNQAIDKLLAAIGGWGPISTRLKWPYRKADPKIIPTLRKEANRILPEFFTNPIL